MNSNICVYCHFPQSRHADSCLIVSMGTMLKQGDQYQSWWDKGWIAGFNGDPEPKFSDDSSDMAGNGWMLGRQARIDLGK